MFNNWLIDACIQIYFCFLVGSWTNFDASDSGKD